jgi:ABC-type multidrug transport system fused ATPase/permease subunit
MATLLAGAAAFGSGAMSVAGPMMITGAVIGGLVSAFQSNAQYDRAKKTLAGLQTKTTSLEAVFKKLQEKNGVISAEIMSETIEAADGIVKYKDEIKTITQSFGDAERQTIIFGIVINMIIILIFVAKIVIIPKLKN